MGGQFIPSLARLQASSRRASNRSKRQPLSGAVPGQGANTPAQDRANDPNGRSPGESGSQRMATGARPRFSSRLNRTLIGKPIAYDA